MTSHSIYKTKWTIAWITNAPAAYPIVYRMPCGSELTTLYRRLIVETLLQKKEIPAGIHPNKLSKCRLSLPISLDHFVKGIVTYLKHPRKKLNDAGISLDREFLLVQFPRLRKATSGWGAPAK